MNWSVFIIAAFVMLVVDASLAQTLAFRGLVPSMLAILVVYVSFLAPRTRAIVAAWAVGLAVDLTADYVQGAGEVGPVLGPHALGFVCGSYIVLLVRPMLLRRSAFTMAVMSFFFSITAAIVVMFILHAHSWYDPVPIRWHAGSIGLEFARRVGAALYTAVIALPVSMVLLATIDLWGFRGQVRSSVRM